MGSLVATFTLNPALDDRATVDRIVPDEKLRCYDVQTDPGGGGVNVARVLQRLEHPCRALWSRAGATGDQYGSLLEGEGLDHLAIPCDRGDTRRSTHIWEAETERQFRFVMPGPELGRAEAERWLGAARELDAAVAVLSGSLPPGVPADFYGQLARAIGGAATVVVDTSGAALKGALGECVDLVKPNRKELAELTGTSLDDRGAVERAARQLIDEGRAAQVVVSLGSEGALAVTVDRAELITAPEVEVKSQIGAGDSMVSGLVHRIAHGDDLFEATRWGVAAGSAALLTEGTMLAWPEDIQTMRDAIDGSRADTEATIP
jgi:6-phosphofructokinase 2